MPLYDFKCENCDKLSEDVYCKTYEDSKNIKCDNCNKHMKKLLVNRVSVHVFPHQGITLEHVAAEPVTFHSKKEMKDYARKNKLELGALL